METSFSRDNGKAGAASNSDTAIELMVLEELGRCPARPLTLARLVAGKTGIPECRALGAIRSLLVCGRIHERKGRLEIDPRKSFGKGTSIQGACAQGARRHDWNFFRRLLVYYMACLRADTGVDCFAWQESLGEDFSYVGREGSWYPNNAPNTPDDSWSLFLDRSGCIENMESLWSSGRDDLVLGYPVHLTRETDPRGRPAICVTPIFLHPLGLRIEENGATLSLLSRSPLLNRRWLGRHLANPGLRKRFLDSTGFRSPFEEPVNDPDPAPDPMVERLDGNRRTTGQNFATLAKALEGLLRSLVREPLDPARPNHEPVASPFVPGIYNKAVLLPGRGASYTAGLVRELEEVAKATDEDLEKTALKYLFLDEASGEVSGQTPMDEGLVADTAPLSPEQRRAVASLLSMPLTVIQGPPGTGKSQVASCACLNARLRGQSVLVTSHNHKAVDAVFSRLAHGDAPLAVRANKKEDPTFHHDFCDDIADMLSERRNQDAASHHAALFRDLDECLAERSLVARQARKRSSMAARLGELEEKLEHVRILLPQALANRLADRRWLTAQKVRALSMASFFARQLHLEKPSLARLFLAHPLGALRFRAIVRALQKDDPTLFLPRWFAKEDQDLLETLDSRLARAASLAEAAFEREEIRRQLARDDTSLEVLVDRLELLGKRVKDLARPLLDLDRERRRGLFADRGDMDDMRRRLFGRDAKHRVDTGRNVAPLAPHVLFHSPIWAVTSLSVGSAIPLVPGLFDLVLIDEASQSNAPSMIPLLFRAKRAGIVGDPKQLSYITQLEHEDDARIARRLGFGLEQDSRLSYAQNSAYSLAFSARAAHPFLLDETWRSAESIARYSSDLFYDGRLRVATREDTLLCPKGMTPGIRWRVVEGEIRREENRGTFCEAEVAETVKAVLELLDQNYPGTIGVVTPFREQADRIEAGLRRHLSVDSREWIRANLFVNTAHGFQGAERDIMIFSLCAGPGISRGALNFLAFHPNLFNVAVSRARAVLLVVGNRDWAFRSRIPHVEALAAEEGLREKSAPKSPWFPHESPYEERLYKALLAHGITTLPQYRVRARRLDLALVDEEHPFLKMDIEVDGDCHFTPEGRARADDHWRDLTLRELGWTTLRFWTFELANDMEGCVRRVEKTRDELMQAWSLKSQAKA